MSACHAGRQRGRETEGEQESGKEVKERGARRKVEKVPACDETQGRDKDGNREL